ncbi:MAG: universal stress protein [Pseudomonadota bacterium]
MYDRLLVPIDLDDQTSLAHALPAAAKLASGPDAEIHVLTVVPTSGMAVVSSYLPEDYAEQSIEGAKTMLADALEAKKTLAGSAKIKGHVARGSVYQEIMRAADKLECDAIVMTAHSPDLRDYLLGPNAARVVRHAKQSVMVIRG